MSHEALEGFALARVASDTPERDAIAGLAAPLRREVQAHLAALRGAEDRRQRLAAAADALRPPVPASCDLTGRAAGLLAGETDRATGRRWLAAAPVSRPGFVASLELRSVLRRALGPERADAAEEERRAARPPAGEAEPFATLAAYADDPTRALGAMRLGARLELGGDLWSRPWRRLGAEHARLGRPWGE